MTHCPRSIPQEPSVSGALHGYFSVGPARAGFESQNALKDYSLAELRSPRSREPASATRSSSGEATSYFCPNKQDQENPARAISSATRLNRSLVERAAIKVTPVAQSTVPSEQGVAGSNPATGASPCSSAAEHLSYCPRLIPRPINHPVTLDRKRSLSWAGQLSKEELQ